MMGQANDRQMFQLFAALLDYPVSNPAAAAEACAAGAAGHSQEAAALLSDFAAFAASASLGRLEEIYTAVFELDATRHPYVGFHLFGESYKRSAFLLALKEHYRRYDIQCGTELPDHLALMLRFLAATEHPAEAEELIRAALHPALRRMLKTTDDEPPDPDLPRLPARGDQYRWVLQALQGVLLAIVPDDAVVKDEARVEDFLPMASD